MASLCHINCFFIRGSFMNPFDWHPSPLAGGFGSNLNIQSARRIGILPENAKNVTVIGNAALGGASMLLLDEKLMEKCVDITQNTILVELATSSAFSEYFMEDMMF